MAPISGPAETVRAQGKERRHFENNEKAFENVSGNTAEECIGWFVSFGQLNRKRRNCSECCERRNCFGQ